MKRIRLATPALAMLLLVPQITEAGQITYSLQDYPADQNGYRLSGSVTTDGALGTLTTADIVAWTWTITGPSGPPLTATGGTTIVSLLVATNEQLLLPGNESAAAEFGLFSSSDDRLAWIRPAGSTGTAPFYYAYNASTASYVWDTSNPGMGGTDPWLIGVAAAAVPEPSSIMLLGIGITGLLTEARRRSCRKART